MSLSFRKKASRERNDFLRLMLFKRKRLPNAD